VAELLPAALGGLLSFEADKARSGPGRVGVEGIDPLGMFGAGDEDPGYVPDYILECFGMPYVREGDADRALVTRPCF